MDGVDQYQCSCPGGYFGQNCECPPEAVDDPSQCIDVNSSVSWDLPPKDVLDSWTTTVGYEEDTTIIPGIDEPDGPDLDSSINPSQTIPIGTPTSTIVYNASDPVTSLYIYEYSSNELITRSFLAGDEYIINYSPTVSPEMGKIAFIIY